MSTTVAFCNMYVEHTQRQFLFIGNFFAVCFKELGTDRLLSR